MIRPDIKNDDILQMLDSPKTRPELCETLEVCLGQRVPSSTIYYRLQYLLDTGEIKRYKDNTRTRGAPKVYWVKCNENRLKALEKRLQKSLYNKIDKLNLTISQKIALKETISNLEKRGHKVVTIGTDIIDDTVDLITKIDRWLETRKGIKVYCQVLSVNINKLNIDTSLNVPMKVMIFLNDFRRCLLC